MGPRDTNDREPESVGSRGRRSMLDADDARAKREATTSHPVSSALLESDGSLLPAWMSNPSLLPKRPPGHK